MELLSDTSPAMWDVSYRRLAEMSPSERIGIAAALWKAGHDCSAPRSARSFRKRMR